MPNKDKLERQIKALAEEPDKQFVARLGVELVKQANQMEAKSRALRYFSVAFGIIACLLLIITLQLNAESEAPAAVGEANSPSVLIYHTHSQESFVSETKTSTEIHSVNDPQHNISLVGKRLADALQSNKVSAIQSAIDFATEAKSKQRDFSELYMMSRENVKEMLAIHTDIQMVLDVHRDSRKRNMTTLKINNTEVAKIRLVINHSHPNWERNLDFVQKISQKAQEMYPEFPIEVIEQKGMSPVYWNQDLHPRAVLVEIGGMENTLEEEYESAEILAKILAELLHEAS